MKGPKNTRSTSLIFILFNFNVVSFKVISSRCNVLITFKKPFCTEYRAVVGFCIHRSFWKTIFYWKYWYSLCCDHFTEKCNTFVIVPYKIEIVFNDEVSSHHILFTHNCYTNAYALWFFYTFLLDWIFIEKKAILGFIRLFLPFNAIKTPNKNKKT